MIIRSQDKKSIINYSSVDKIYIRETDIWINARDGVVRIAAYSTEEKAIKVLDMIQAFYEMHDYAKFMGKEDAIYGSCIFQMPQDSEV